MKLTNYEVYYYTQQLSSVFTNASQCLPAKINFLLQKNIQILTKLAQQIEENRIIIIQRYSSIETETNKVKIAEEYTEQVQKELENLFAIEQEVNISFLKLDDFGNTELTLEQMNAIMFMIEE